MVGRANMINRQVSLECGASWIIDARFWHACSECHAVIAEYGLTSAIVPIASMGRWNEDGVGLERGFEQKLQNQKAISEEVIIKLQRGVAILRQERMDQMGQRFDEKILQRGFEREHIRLKKESEEQLKMQEVQMADVIQQMMSLNGDLNQAQQDRADAQAAEQAIRMLQGISRHQ